PPTAIDACDSPVYIIVVSDDSIPGSSPGNYSRKICWAATDGGGNESDTVCQTINVVSDTTATCIPPIVTASNNGPLCAGGTLNLSSTGGSATAYTWTGPNGFTSTLQNPVISDINTSASGTYTVTVSNEPGCSAFSTTSVVIHSTYNITLASVISCANYTL